MIEVEEEKGAGEMEEEGGVIKEEIDPVEESKMPMEAGVKDTPQTGKGKEVVRKETEEKEATTEEKTVP